MASYTSHHDISADEHLHYDEEFQLFADLEDKFEETKGRFQKNRERKTRLLLDEYLAKKQREVLYKDLYDPDLGEKGNFSL